jgi:hypothetical protein
LAPRKKKLAEPGEHRPVWLVTRGLLRPEPPRFVLLLRRGETHAALERAEDRIKFQAPNECVFDSEVEAIDAYVAELNEIENWVLERLVEAGAMKNDAINRAEQADGIAERALAA